MKMYSIKHLLSYGLQEVNTDIDLNPYSIDAQYVKHNGELLKYNQDVFDTKQKAVDAGIKKMLKEVDAADRKKKKTIAIIQKLRNTRFGVT